MTSSGFGGSSGADCKSAETSSILSAASYSSSTPNHDRRRFSAAAVAAAGYPVPPPALPPPAHRPQQAAASQRPPASRGVGGTPAVASGKPVPKPLMAETIVLRGRDFVVYHNNSRSTAARAQFQSPHQQQQHLQQEHFPARARSLQTAHPPPHQQQQHHRRQHSCVQALPPLPPRPSQQPITNAITTNQNRVRHSRVTAPTNQTRARHSRLTATTHIRPPPPPPAAPPRKAVHAGNGAGHSSSMSSDISCEVCHVSVNSSQQLQAHLAGMFTLV